LKLASTGNIAAASRHRTRDATRALAVSDSAGLTEKDIAPLCRAVPPGHRIGTQKGWGSNFLAAPKATAQDVILALAGQA